MLNLKGSLMLAGLAIALGGIPEIGAAQGKGGGKGQGQEKSEGKGKGQGQGQGQSKAKGQDQAVKQDRGRGRSDEAQASRGAGGGKATASAAREKGNKGAKAKFTRATSVGSLPASVRRVASNGRAKNLIAAGAVAHAYARGRDDDFRIDEVGNRMRIVNRKGQTLVDIDDESAGRLGRWRVDVVGDDVREGAPSFCRSGAGHPVWGREWCINKGFGLGGYNDYRWGRTTNVGDIVFPRSGIGSILGTVALASLLGNDTFNRLALHAVTLGLAEPITGRWVAQPAGPQLLMVNSGPYPVAELVDNDRDFRVEDLLVALLPW